MFNAFMILICIVVMFLFIRAFIYSEVNRLSHDFIRTNRSKIDDLLDQHRLYLNVLGSGYSLYDEYSIAYKGEEHIYKLPPRKIKRLLSQLKKNKTDSDFIIDYMKKNGDLIKQPTAWDKF